MSSDAVQQPSDLPPVEAGLPADGDTQEMTLEQAGDASGAHIDVSYDDDTQDSSVSTAEAAPDTTDPESSDDGRWDHQKASTIAPLLKEGIQKKDEHERELTAANKSRDDAYRNKERAAYVGDEQAVEYFDAELQSREEAVGHVENSEPLDTSPSVLSGAEFLYDLNPDKFADMPTKDFMELVKELNLRDHLVDGAARRASSLAAQQELLGERLDSKLPLDSQELWHLGDTLPTEKVRQITDDVFDKSPRQIIEGLSALTRESQAKAKHDQETATSNRQTFLDQFKSKN